MDLPETWKPFILRRFEDTSKVSGIGVVAWGLILPSELVVMRWLKSPEAQIRQVSIWNDLAEVQAIHGHAGMTVAQVVSVRELLTHFASEEDFWSHFLSMRMAVEGAASELMLRIEV